MDGPLFEAFGRVMAKAIDFEMEYALLELTEEYGVIGGSAYECPKCHRHYKREGWRKRHVRRTDHLSQWLGSLGQKYL